MSHRFYALLSNCLLHHFDCPTRASLLTLKKKKGIWTLDNALDGISAISLAILTRPKEENGLGWSRAEVEVLLASVRRELKDTSIHCYVPMYVSHASSQLTVSETNILTF